MAVLIGWSLDILEIVVCICRRVDERQIRRRNTSGVLVCRGFERQDAIADGLVILRRRIGPERFDSVPERMAESLDVCVAALRDDRFDGRWVGESETQTDWCAVVEDIDSVGGDLEGREERADSVG